MNMFYIIFTFVLLLWTTVSEAKSNGKAFIPHFLTNLGSKALTYLYFSNVTDHTLDIEIKLLDASGNTIHDDNGISTGYIYGYNAASYFEPNSNSSVNFTILPHTTSSISLHFSQSKIGHGEIFWKADGVDIYKALVAYGRVARSGSAYPIIVNNGLPF